jgi:hypothetical protein
VGSCVSESIEKADVKESEEAAGRAFLALMSDLADLKTAHQRVIVQIEALALRYGVSAVVT